MHLSTAHLTDKARDQGLVLKNGTRLIRWRFPHTHQEGARVGQALQKCGDLLAVPTMPRLSVIILIEAESGIQ